MWLFFVNVLQGWIYWATWLTECKLENQLHLFFLRNPLHCQQRLDRVEIYLTAFNMFMTELHIRWVFMEPIWSWLVRCQAWWTHNSYLGLGTSELDPLYFKQFFQWAHYRLLHEELHLNNFNNPYFKTVLQYYQWIYVKKTQTQSYFCFSNMSLTHS